jgi:hypothetical protein
MPSVTAWRCVCGNAVRVMYEANGTTTARCPEPKCSKEHHVAGKISGIWIEQNGEPRSVDFAPLIVDIRPLGIQSQT